MAKGPKFTVALRRKREEKTNYRRRLALLKSRLHRLVIRKTLQAMICQVVEYKPDGDKVLINISSRDLEQYGLPVVNCNVPVAYLTGVLVAKEVKKLNITGVVVDIGLQKLTKESKIYATIKGIIDGGLAITANDAVLPTQDRVNGKHIETYAKLLAKDAPAYKKQFSAYLAKNVDPATISSLYAKVKEALK
jgi:large subunit ribosomal protein L18